jgi:hypothetical protein
MKEQMIKSLAYDALDVGLNSMCEYIQEQLNVTDGGLAGMVFAFDSRLNGLRKMLIEYIELELENKE